MFPHNTRGPVPVDPPTSAAIGALEASARAAASLLSVGLEPSRAYLPAGFDDSIEGHERFLRIIIDATADLAAAYKFNLAFFESLGPRGVDLLYRLRDALPPAAFVIADAKRSDIGTTAQHYARALYDDLRADSCTVNPLMGRDSCDPFLAYEKKLTFFLVLTSNPGARDFLIPGGLYAAIARALVSWNTHGNAGFVVGATNPDHVSEIRALAPGVPFLVPGIGAQGGELDAVASLGCRQGAGFPGLLFHVTRGLLPQAGDEGDPRSIIRAKALDWRRRINRAVAAAPGSAWNAPS